MSKKDEALKLALEAVYETIIQWDEGGGKRSRRELARRIVALAEQPAPVANPHEQEPEIVQRVKRFTGQTMRTVRNPNITARECIELANWIAAAQQPAQGETK